MPPKKVNVAGFPHKGPYIEPVKVTPKKTSSDTSRLSSVPIRNKPPSNETTPEQEESEEQTVPLEGEEPDTEESEIAAFSAIITHPTITQPVVHDIIPVKSNYEILEWDGSSFYFLNMIRIYTIGDGSCFFHAIMNAINKVYRSERSNSIVITRGDIVKNLRKALGYRLSEPAVPNGEPTDTHYHRLGGGSLKLMSVGSPQYRILEMQARLRNPNQHVGNEYNEFISDQLNIDIYILDGTTRDIYMTGDDWDRLYKNRDSVVLLYMPGHYELVGLLTDRGTDVTLFKFDHPFIKAIRARMVELCHN